MYSTLFRIPIPFLDVSFPIHAYGAMLALAFFVAIVLATKRAARFGLSPTIIQDVSLYSVVFGLLGARLHYVIRYMLDTPHSFWEYFSFWKGGLVFQGGLFCAILANVLYLRAKHVSFGKVADCFAPGLALGYVFARVGCFLNGCCFGQIAPKDFPLGVTFPPGSPAYEFQHIPEKFGEIKNMAEQVGYEFVNPSMLPLPEHPVQLYSSVAMLGVFVLVLLWDRWVRRFDGLTMLVFLILYSVQRFLIEYLRMDTDRYAWLWNWNSAQVLSLLTVVGSLILIVVLYRRKRSV